MLVQNISCTTALWHLLARYKVQHTYLTVALAIIVNNRLVFFNFAVVVNIKEQSFLMYPLAFFTLFAASFTAQFLYCSTYGEVSGQ